MNTPAETLQSSDLAAEVADLKRQLHAATVSRERYRTLALDAPGHLLLVNRNLCIEFANDVFLQASGWTFDAAMGRHLSEVLGQERFDERREYYDRALAGESLAYESIGAAGNPNGFFHFSYRPSYDGSGTIQGIVSVAVDVSERRLVEKELKAKQAELLRSNQDLEQFAYVASHDLKAPLRAIDLLVQWIREELEDYNEGDVQENLGLLGQRTQRLIRLLDDLLAYSRAGRKVGACRQTDCRDLVLGAIALLNPPETFNFDVAQSLPTFETYTTPLEQVFRNLISNAIKHHPGPNGCIGVTCEERDDRYLFAVSDDGAGIPTEYAKRIFEMFQTLKPRDEVEGSGMGLAIVDRIVNWQGGSVHLENNPDCETGTVFKFEWLKTPPVLPNGEDYA